MSTLTIYLRAEEPIVLREHQRLRLDRERLAPGNRRFSQAHAPQIYWAQGQWHVYNHYTDPRNRLVVEHTDSGRIYRISVNSSQQLNAGDSHIYVADRRVGVVVDGVADEPAPAPGNTFTDGLGADADLKIQQLLQNNLRYHTTILVRFQEFIDPKEHDPQPLKARQVSECAADIDLNTANAAQREVKKVTGLDASVELGDWLTHRGILLASDQRKVPHTSSCRHSRHPQSGNGGDGFHPRHHAQTDTHVNLQSPLR